MIGKKQKELIDYLITKLKVLPVDALFIKGSLARDSGDEYSDVDFYCLTTSKELYNKLLAERDEILEGYKPIIYKSYQNFGDEQLVIIYNNNIHLDFYLTSKIPLKGTDEIKALYDPNNLLSSYKRINNIVENEMLVNKLNSSIYTLQEIYVAYNRKDKLWLTRLLSHMLADISTIMSYLYDPKRPVIHIKGLYGKLPDDIKKKVDTIMNYMTPENASYCIKEMIELLEIIINIQDKKILDKLHLQYLEYMKNTFNF